MEDQPSRDSVYAWMREREDFSDMYARAREERADLLFERIAAIAEDATGDYVKKEDGTWVVDHENIQRSRLRVDTMKWMASKLAPRKYGDRVEHDHKGGLNFQPAVLVQIGGGAPEPVEVSGKVIEEE
jgi:terminase small subunit-like protein